MVFSILRDIFPILPIHNFLNINGVHSVFINIVFIAMYIYTIRITDIYQYINVIKYVSNTRIISAFSTTIFSQNINDNTSYFCISDLNFNRNPVLTTVNGS